jgi:flavin-dependent dehydrogenase
MTVDVAIVGGGPAGAVLAARLARRGYAVVVFERSPAYRWRACGVFSSPASVEELRAAGLDDETLRQVARPAPAMRVETSAGTTFRLTYGDDGPVAAPAVSFDRSGLDPELLSLAERAGAKVRRGEAVVHVEPGRVVARGPDGESVVEARVVVGADGIRSSVARAFGVVRAPRLGDRVGLTFHVAQPGTPGTPATPPLRDARMILFRDGYVGLALVPGGRVNVGIVLGRSWAARLREDGAERTVKAVLAAIPAAADDPVDWRRAERCDPIEGAKPLGHRVARRHGRDWLLVGDAAGFLDPFTGEGLHRALVSARLAAVAIERHLAGDGSGLAGYDRALTARFRSKDALSLVVQGFLSQPSLFEYAARRLAGRNEVRETMGLVMGDLVPASRGLDPRFVATLLRP